MKKDDPRSNALPTALEIAERKLAERETLLAAAIGHAETARSQYEQAHERAESLRRRLAAKEDQLSTAQAQLEAAFVEITTSREALNAREQRISALQQELQQRYERIVTLQQLCEENDNALNAINQDAKRQNVANPSERLSAMGLVLESLEEPGIQHRIGRVTTTLGRAAANDIAINSSSVSRYHARIVVEADAVYLIDLQSTNGCSVNGQRTARQALGDGDVIAIGDTKFRLSLGVPLADNDDRSMDATYPLLDDAVVLTPAPGTKPHSAHAKPKTK